MTPSTPSPASPPTPSRPFDEKYLDYLVRYLLDVYEHYPAAEYTNYRDQVERLASYYDGGPEYIRLQFIWRVLQSKSPEGINVSNSSQMPLNARQLFEPMLCETGNFENLADLTASGEWRFQPKYDGMRVVAFKGKNRYFILNRSGDDVTERFPEVLEKLENCPDGTMLDGEIVVLDGEDEDEENAKRGRVIPVTRVPNFNRLQQRINLTDMNQVFAQVAINPVTLIVFDVYGVSNQLINNHTFEERQAMLEHLPVDRAPVFTDGVELWDELTQLNWEGLVAKKNESRYEIGARSAHWLKFKQA